ncbi:hypothetical protein AVME950_02155 [Acidovorax sp. SUPP950]|uniref:hypothetical protein n=1 Tax=Acidovorax sp. SUPP950 TaxID=511901 RepID=UPI0023D710B0|nr:hypothetical protein [Acidovorax sp. SUPP950]GKS73649.1 hypothetical protein AVME950_02155 [Acidovorax sp. SUPP950]
MAAIDFPASPTVGQTSNSGRFTWNGTGWVRTKTPTVIPIAQGGTGSSTAAGARAALSVREQLMAARTYYVRTDGNDSNTGLANTAGAAFLTIQKAVDVAATLDNGGFDVTISVGAGTYAAGFRLRSFVGSGKIIVTGAAADLTSTVISVTSGSCVISEAPTAGNYRIQYLKIQTTTSGYGIVLYGGANYLEISNINVGACASGQITIGNGSTVNAFGASYTISGNSPTHIDASDGGVFRGQFGAVTLSGAPAFGSCYANAARLGLVTIFSTTFTGSASGARYLVSTNAVIFTAGTGASYLPGSTAGSTTTGGQYA